MRGLLIIIGLLLVGSVEYLSISANSGAKAVIEWEEMSYDFGEIPINKPIKVNFSFSNPGMIPLIINDVKTSCGCTVADFPKQPVNSGATGVVSVTFDAKSPGHFSKTVSVYSNSQDGVTNLYIKGIVVR